MLRWWYYYDYDWYHNHHQHHLFTSHFTSSWAGFKLWSRGAAGKMSRDMFPSIEAVSRRAIFWILFFYLRVFHTSCGLIWGFPQVSPAFQDSPKYSRWSGRSLFFLWSPFTSVFFLVLWDCSRGSYYFGVTVILINLTVWVFHTILNCWFFTEV